MSITIKEGDLFTTAATIIGHQVNACGAMNSGVARQVREKYPKAYEKYIELCESKIELLGIVQYVPVSIDRFIANMFGQRHYGYDGKQYTSLSALRRCLLNLHEYATRQQCSIALPYNIGCCRGGADWETQVFPIIKEIFEDSDVSLEIWRLNKG